MVKKLLTLDMKPSLLMRRMLKHSGDVSENSKHTLIAERVILNKKVEFYSDGLRIVKGIDITEDEMFNSELLKLAHASILINAAVGDKRKCYVDATKNPVEIWIYNQPIKQYVNEQKVLMEL